MALSKEVLKLKGRARKAGIAGYGKMSPDELRDALAGGGTSSGKRKSASALKSGKRKSASAVGRKNTGRKQTRKSATAVTKPKRGRPKGSTNRKSVATPRRKAASNGNAGRNLIDRSGINWKAEWGGGQSGNRALIMKALRKYKGNYDKVYDALVGQVAKMYPKSTKTGQKYNQDERKALLRWHIGRTAFDFVTGTEQHTKSTNRKPDKRTSGRKVSKTSSNGDVKDMSDQKLRKIVKAAAGKRGRKSGEVIAAARELEKRSRAQGKGKTTRATGTRKKAAQRRAGGSKRKRQTVKR